MSEQNHPEGGSSIDVGPNEFYVGYLPAPVGHARFVRRTVGVVLAGLAVVAITVAAFHEDPGTGTWDTSQSRTFEGVVLVAPYAMIRTEASASGGPERTLLLVREGKFGAIDRVKALDGQRARVRGYVLERDGRRLLELESTETAVQALDAPRSDVATSPRRPVTKPMGTVTLRGEIIDPKCYFGAMKPGEGKVHKECATLCIAGGIPPMFKTVDASGRAEYYLLTRADGSAANEVVLPFVADVVEIRGELERRDDLLVLRIDPADIRRL